MKPEIVEELARAAYAVDWSAPHHNNFDDAPTDLRDRYVAMAKALAPIIDRLVSEAREATEAAIVAWLRKDAAEWRGGYPDGAEKASAVDLAAEAIEAGAHRG